MVSFTDLVLGGNRLSQNVQRTGAEASSLSAVEQKSINSLEAQIEKHTAKLEAYKADPWANDNAGRLAGAPSQEIQQTIIQGRISKLELEIQHRQDKGD